MSSLATRLAVLAGSVATVGCGGDGQPPPGPITFHPVSGQVLVAGKPAAGMRVAFFATSAPVPPQVPSNPHATTGPDGRFQLGTAAESDGAAEGGYQIVLSWPPEVKEGEEPSGGDRLLGWYDLANTKLTFKVKAGANVVPPIDVPLRTTPPPPTDGIPGRN